MWKPSERTPLTAIATTSLLARAAERFGEVPDGLFELVPTVAWTSLGPCPLAEIDHLVVDDGLPREWRQKIEQAGVSLHLAPLVTRPT